MLDIKYITEHPDKIRDSIHKRRVEADLDYLLEAYAIRKNEKLNLDILRTKANQIAKRIPTLSEAEKKSLLPKAEN